MTLSIYGRIEFVEHLRKFFFGTGELRPAIVQQPGGTACTLSELVDIAIVGTQL